MTQLQDTQLPATQRPMVDYRAAITPCASNSAHKAHSVEKRRCDSQAEFLAHYAELGSILHATAATGVRRETHYDWLRAGHCDYARRWDHARQVHRERLEAMVYARLEDPTGNRGSDVLAIFALKKAWPDKYDDKPPVVNIDARSISAELAQIGRALLPAPAPALPAAQQEETHPPRA